MNMFRLLRADEIDCRISQIAKDGSWLDLLLYKDARCDMNILDESVGPFNWRREHSRDNANCTVSIWDEEKQLWVSKEDTGTESNTEAAKGLASDSFKRACFNWGIGRELYSAPRIRIWSDKCSIVENGSRFNCYDGFTVKSISYNEREEIESLCIWNEKRGEAAFTWEKGKDTAARKPAQKPAKQPASAVKNKDVFTPTCTDCGAEIEDVVHDFSVRYFGVPLCRACQKKRPR